MTELQLSARPYERVNHWTEKARRTLTHPLSMSYWNACVQELTAFKPGNVHCYAEGHDMTVEQFLISAYVTAPIMSNPRMTLGSRIYESVRVTQEAVGQNTNLGIILLCAPIAYSALHDHSKGFRNTLVEVLNNSDLNDAQLILDAIRLAAPSGLGKSEKHDVFYPAAAGIREIMSAAGSKDLIAQQYANGFAEIFDFGLRVMQKAQAHDISRYEMANQIYLAFLSGFLDSHILRQHGREVAEEVKELAGHLYSKVRLRHFDSIICSELMKCDKLMKVRDINPGTSADMTVATIFTNETILVIR